MKTTDGVEISENLFTKGSSNCATSNLWGEVIEDDPKTPAQTFNNESLEEVKDKVEVKIEPLFADESDSVEHKLQNESLIEENIEIDDKYNIDKLKIEMVKVETTDETNISGVFQKLWNCTHCTYKCKRKGMLENHIFHRHFKKLKCTKCEFSTKSIMRLRQHIKKKHTVGNWYYCVQCSYNRYVSFVHDTPRDFKCHICGRDFVRKPCYTKPTKRMRAQNLKKPDSANNMIVRMRKSLSTLLFGKTCLPGKCQINENGKTLNQGEIGISNAPDEPEQDRTNMQKEAEKYGFTISSNFLQCSQCPYKTSQMNNMKTHFNNYLISANYFKWNRCAYCSYKHRCTGKLQDHILQEHEFKDSVNLQ